MLTSLTVRNFKRLKSTDKIPLQEAVVFIGPNNSGKTTALQALSLWWFGVQKWGEKRGKGTTLKQNGSKPTVKRTGVPINRKDLFALPIAQNKLLWADLFVLKTTRDENGKIIGNQDVNIEIEVEGITDGQSWQCGLEFEYRDEEVLYCRPLRDFPNNALLDTPHLLASVKIAFLPPMSGLKTEEEKLLNSTVEARIGEGRTAEVLRNVVYTVLHPESERQRGNRVPHKDWGKLCKILKSLFMVDLQNPEINSRGELTLFYEDERKNRLEIASAGRGLQQILLLLSYMMTNPDTVMLFDEPDAHLEVLKQSQVYNLLKELGRNSNVQILSASHSEVILRESATEDIVIGFLPAGKPKQINDRGSQILKSLKSFGFDHYVFAEQKGWVLYLEGSTDLDMLKKFALKLQHPAQQFLEAPFSHYLGSNLPNLARDHFHALREAIPDLKGVALFDKITNPLEKGDLHEMMWERREIENYFFRLDLFEKFAKGNNARDLFDSADQGNRQKSMQEALEDVIPRYARKNPDDDFWKNDKASEWMERVFKIYFKNLKLPVNLSKNKYFQLIDFLEEHEIDIEIKEKLDAIVMVGETIAKRGL
jgi:energy-coupling factor transporter ATP-binding protein EcfA2